MDRTYKHDTEVLAFLGQLALDVRQGSKSEAPKDETGLEAAISFVRCKQCSVLETWDDETV
jgi:hypothetical protein